MNKLIGYLGIAISLFIMFVGGYIAVTQFLPAPPPIFRFEWPYFKEHTDHFNYLMGALLVAYGIFRFVRSYRIINDKQS